MLASKRNLINILISLIGIGIVVLYSVCGQSCLYLKGNILSLDLSYIGIIFMAMVILLTLFKRRFLLLLLLSSAIGVEIYLVGFQIKTDVYCPYCLAFGGTILFLFLWNFDLSKKTYMAISLVLGLLLFSILFEGSVTPVYGGGSLLPSYGKGQVKVILFADYFCPPCRQLEPRIEPVLVDLMDKEMIHLTFVDTPTSPQTALYARYFIYALNANNSFQHALLVRNILFEAADKMIKEKGKLEEFLQHKGIEIRPMDLSFVFNFWNRLLKENNIHTTPSCVITNGEKKIFKGSVEVLKALENLKENFEKGRKAGN